MRSWTSAGVRLRAAGIFIPTLHFQISYVCVQFFPSYSFIFVFLSFSFFVFALGFDIGL